jgi:hypothetical protein
MNRPSHSRCTNAPFERASPDYLDISNNSVNYDDDKHTPDRPSEAKHMKQFDTVESTTRVETEHPEIISKMYPKRFGSKKRATRRIYGERCSPCRSRRDDVANPHNEWIYTHPYRIYRIAVGCAPWGFRRSMESQALDLRFVAAGDVSCVA